MCNYHFWDHLAEAFWVPDNQLLPQSWCNCTGRRAYSRMTAWPGSCALIVNKAQNYAKRLRHQWLVKPRCFMATKHPSAPLPVEVWFRS
jgi:hypothetical protein